MQRVVKIDNDPQKWPQVSKKIIVLMHMVGMWKKTCV